MDDTIPKAVSIPNTTKATTVKGPHGGGTPYHVAKVSNEFFVIDSRPGHSQKVNVKDNSK